MCINLAIKSKKIIKKIKDCYKKKNKYRDLLLFTLGINTGMKLTELLSLDVKDIKNKKILKLKNGINFVLTEEIQDLVKEVITNKNPNSPLFESRLLKPLNRTVVFKEFKNICKNLSLQDISVESWRKTFGYWYYKEYKDLYFLQWYFGHQSANQTMKYIEVQESISDRYTFGVAL